MGNFLAEPYCAEPQPITNGTLFFVVVLVFLIGLCVGLLKR